MKLVPKLTLALVAAMCCVLAVNGVLRVRRELAYVHADRVRDHEMIGRALAIAVTTAWQNEGRDSALKLVDAAELNFSRIAIHFRGPGEVGEQCADVWSNAGEFEAAPAGQPFTHDVTHGSGTSVHTCVAIDTGQVRRGAVEFLETVAPEAEPIREVVKDAAITALAIVLVSALLSLVLGVWFVGRPVSALVDKARRIGRGDFSGPVTLPSAGEFTVLASEMNAMAERLSSVLDQLRHADRLSTVGKLASGVAHELGTPLNVISARAAMIAAGETSPSEAIDYAAAISRAATRMTNIIRQLLEFARKKGPNRSRQNVLLLVEQVVDLLRPLAIKRNVHLLIADVDSSLDTTVLVDAPQLEQVLTNIVINAIQAMPKGGQIQVRHSRERAVAPGLSSARASEYLCIRVRDEGEGIAPEHIEHIFEPFYTTKDVGAGTGLGLSVSYGIVQEHGGFITVASERFKGSTFSIYLPSVES
jgi:two-component system NtrC family sensor kinase